MKNVNNLMAYQKRAFSYVSVLVQYFEKAYFSVLFQVFL